MMDLTRTQRLQDAVDDVKEEIKSYERIRNWAVAASVLSFLILCGSIAAGVISNIYNTIDIGGAVFGCCLVDLCFGGAAVGTFFWALEDRNPKRLRWRLKAAERAYRDAMAEMGLG